MAAAVPSPEGLVKAYPVAKQFTIAGKKVEIPAASIRHCTEVFQHAAVMAVSADAESANELIYADEHPKEFGDLLELATKLDREWIDSLDAFGKIELYQKYLEVNGAFFALRVLPAMLSLQGELNATFGIGSTPSSTSRVTDTPTPTTTLPKQSKPGRQRSIAPNGANAASA